MACPSRNQLEDDNTMQYISYELVQDTAVKEGENHIGKWNASERILAQKTSLQNSKKTFKSFANHKLEAWYLNTVKNYACNVDTQHPQTLFSVSNFAQNLKLSKKQEISEEYFHKKQISIFATVSCVKTFEDENMSLQHSVLQITSSDVK